MSQEVDFDNAVPQPRDERFLDDLQLWQQAHYPFELCEAAPAEAE